MVGFYLLSLSLLGLLLSAQAMFPVHLQLLDLALFWLERLSSRERAGLRPVVNRQEFPQMGLYKSWDLLKLKRWILFSVDKFSLISHRVPSGIPKALGKQTGRR
jgi:hypothetical protein